MDLVFSSMAYFQVDQLFFKVLFKKRMRMELADQLELLTKNADVFPSMSTQLKLPTNSMRSKIVTQLLKF